MKVTIERPVLEIKKDFSVGELQEWQDPYSSEQYVVMITNPKSHRLDLGFQGVVIQSTCSTWGVGHTDETFIYSEFKPFKGKLIIEV